MVSERIYFSNKLDGYGHISVELNGYMIFNSMLLHHSTNFYELVDNSAWIFIMMVFYRQI